MSGPFDLRGLRAAPAQTRGAFRLVPLLRDRPCVDVRLDLRTYGEDVAAVALPDGSTYVAYVPHGLVLTWGDGEVGTALGAQARDGRARPTAWGTVRHLDRMVKREGPRALRLLPLHVALEGFLALHFGGPTVAWHAYSRFALRFGLGCRMERGVPGRALPGFEDALRTFELHEGQVGVLVFAADALASAFVVGSPEDYRRLHATVLEDLFGDLVERYALLYPEAGRVEAELRGDGARDVADLRAALARVRDEWAEYTRDVLASGLVGKDVTAERVYRPGKLVLERFVTDLRPGGENHVGERLVREDGEVLYLKTFRLNEAQTRRAYLLSRLAAHDWHLGRTAQDLGTTEAELIRRLENAGFGYLISTNVREQAAKERRRR